MSPKPHSSLPTLTMLKFWASCILVSGLTALVVTHFDRRVDHEPNSKPAALRDVISRAKADSDHERAFRDIERALLLPLENCASGSGPHCDQEQARFDSDARDEAAKISLRAAMEGEGWALDLPTRSPMFPFGALSQREDTLVRIAAITLERTEKADQASPDDLFRAGLMFRFGAYVQQDFRKAEDLWELAWTKGNVMAPAQLAELAKIQKEPESAYLWAIRCTKPCVLEQRLDRFFEGIPPDEIRAIQKLAKSKSMVGYSSGRYSTAD